MTPAERTDAIAYDILAQAIADGSSPHQAVLSVQTLYASRAAEAFWNAHVGVTLSKDALRAAAIATYEDHARESVKLHAHWAPVADQPEFDAMVSGAIGAVFKQRLDELYINAKAWGLIA